MKIMILNRMREPSTWRGASLFLAAIGMPIAPEMWEYIVGIGMGLSGLVGLITPDSQG
ncbi:hypothetical protein [Magnetococcus sp. PR-3]|uniref:hypothetical protein n=1 Tax=Magnetococcus sp. PR-3 TaxID=3120355 RepID=UPI002FCE6876